MDDVEGDDDDDLWDGWGEEATAQDTTQNQIQNVLLADANIINSSSSNIAEDKKKIGGGGGGGDYKVDIKYDKNDITNTTTNKKNNKNNKDGDGIKGPGSACKPVSSRAQQQQKRKEIKALKFDREKAKRLETIMIKAQKLQLYEEEKKFRNLNEQEKEKIDKKTMEKMEISECESKIENKIENGKGDQIIENKSLSSDSKEIKMTPLSVTSSVEIKKSVEKSNTENRGEDEGEKKDGEDEKEGIRSIAGTGQETIEVDATVVEKVVQKVRKDVEKEGEVCDGDTNHEYGDSDSVEEDDDDDDADHDVEVEVEVGSKNVLTPSNQEDDDDALLKRRSLGRGFLRDIMAEYDNSNLNPKSNISLNVLKETKECSSLTSKTEQLSLPLSSSVIATIRASDLGSDPRLSELLGTLAASQQSCLKLWSPKKVSENAYTKVSVRTYILFFNFEKCNKRNICIYS